MIDNFKEEIIINNSSIYHSSMIGINKTTFKKEDLEINNYRDKIINKN